MSVKKSFLLIVLIAVLGAGSVEIWKWTHPSPEDLVSKIQKLWIHSQKAGNEDMNISDALKEQPLADLLMSYGPAGARAAEDGALDPDQGRREASIFLLGIIKDKDAIPLLTKYATSGTKDDRYAALSALQMSFPPPYGRDAFLAVIKQPESTTTQVAIDGLIRFHNPEWVPLIIPLLRGHYFGTRGSAIRFLGNSGGKIAYEALLARRKEFEHLKPKKGEWSFTSEIDDLEKNIRSARNNQIKLVTHP